MLLFSQGNQIHQVCLHVFLSSPNYVYNVAAFTGDIKECYFQTDLATVQTVNPTMVLQKVELINTKFHILAKILNICPLKSFKCVYLFIFFNIPWIHNKNNK
jgi:hypothetical protein